MRKQVGMVFQRPNPLPISIRDNVLFGYNLYSEQRKIPRSEKDEIVESCGTRWHQRQSSIQYTRIV